MQITGTLQIRAMTGDALLAARLDDEIARVQALSDAGIEALCSLLDAMDTSDVARKIARFVTACANPGAVLGRMYERAPGELAAFCTQLAAYRTYMERIATGDTPVRAAAHAEQARRDWLAQASEAHRVGEARPAAALDQDIHGVDTSGLDMDYEPIDVFDADGELDPGAVRAEIDRLLRRLNVAPERIEIQVLHE